MVTDEMIEAFVKASSVVSGDTMDCVRAGLEAALSTDAEPVAWLAEGQGWGRVFIHKEAAEMMALEEGKITPLYKRRFSEDVLKPVGQVDASYGKEGMLVACYKPNSLPVGTKLYAAPPAPSVAVKTGLLRKIANTPVTPESRRFTDTNAQNEVIGYERAEWMINQVFSAFSAQVKDVADLPQSPWSSAIVSMYNFPSTSSVAMAM